MVFQFACDVVVTLQIEFDHGLYHNPLQQIYRNEACSSNSLLTRVARKMPSEALKEEFQLYGRQLLPLICLVFLEHGQAVELQLG